MTPIDFAALGRLDAAATPAPWRADFGGFHIMDPRNEDDIASCDLGCDGQLLTAARNALPDLMAVVGAAARLRREEQMGFPNGTRVRRHRISLDAALSRFTNVEAQP